MIAGDLIYQSDVVEIHLNKEHKYLQAFWLKLSSREEYKITLRLVASYVTSYKVDKALFDVRKRVYLDIADQTADQKWLEEEISPLIKDIEGLRFAYLITQEDYESMYTNHAQGLILDRSAMFNQVDVGFFLDKQEAQDWLLNS